MGQFSWIGGSSKYKLWRKRIRFGLGKKFLSYALMAYLFFSIAFLMAYLLGFGLKLNAKNRKRSPVIKVFLIFCRSSFPFIWTFYIKLLKVWMGDSDISCIDSWESWKFPGVTENGVSLFLSLMVHITDHCLMPFIPLFLLTFSLY